MSCSLSYRRTPVEDEWRGCFKGSLRDLLYKRFGGGNIAIEPKDIPYLEGVRDASGSDQVEDIDRILKILNEGGTVDLSYDC